MQGSNRRATRPEFRASSRVQMQDERETDGCETKIDGKLEGPQKEYDTANSSATLVRSSLLDAKSIRVSGFLALGSVN